MSKVVEIPAKDIKDKRTRGAVFMTEAKPKIRQTKMLVTCQRFGDLFLFGLVWQYSIG